MLAVCHEQHYVGKVSLRGFLPESPALSVTITLLEESLQQPSRAASMAADSSILYFYWRLYVKLWTFHRSEFDKVISSPCPYVEDNQDLQCAWFKSSLFFSLHLLYVILVSLVSCYYSLFCV